MTLIRLVIFTILVPCTVAWWIPAALLKRSQEEFDIAPLNYLGALVILVGIVFYARSALAFLIEGKGTPAIWFTRPIRFLLGEEPSSFVGSGFYTRTRNPMYVGVTLAILGQAILLQKFVLLQYAVIVWLLFHLVVVFIEEPHLREKFGEPYANYLRTTPRWFSFKKKGTSHDT